MAGVVVTAVLMLSVEGVAAQPAPELSIRVTAEGRPVADAAIRVAGATAETDAAGLATLRDPGGALTIEVTADGYQPVSIAVPPGPRVTAPIEVELEPVPGFDEAVVVTARSPTRLEDQPLRVEVIDREEVEEKALMTPGSVAMLVGETTGLRVQPTAPSLGASNVRIQGLRGRYSQLLADGLPLYGGQGDSLSLLQVAPLDLGRVEIIKGVASALYGASALGGVINLVSRRPAGPARELLLNQTSLAGTDATVWWAERPSAAWSWSVLGGAHRQSRRDRDGDGWTDVPGYARAAVRPRVYYDDGRGRTLLATAGVIAEDRDGGTLPDGRAPDGGPFRERLETRRADAGLVARWLTAGGRVAAVRGSYGRQQQDRRFGNVRERGVRDTTFGEASIQGQAGGHVWVVGTAYQRDRYAAEDLPAFDYTFHAPGVFVQDEIARGRLRLAVSGRLDAHSEYGALATPRTSLLWRPDPAWTLRLSAGGGAFAPTPFVEDTDETGLSPTVPPAGLAAERAWGGSADLTRYAGPLELTGTLFASHVRNPVRLEPGTDGRSRFGNADGPIRTWGSEGLGRYRQGPLVATVTYAYTRSTEDADPGSADGRVEVALTPRHYAAFDVMVEGGRGRVGVEAYYVGRQALDDNPYRMRAPSQVIVGALAERRFAHLRVFANAENLADRRQTRYDPLVRPVREPDGRWTVSAWGPLDGRVINAGVRLVF